MATALPVLFASQPLAAAELTLHGEQPMFALSGHLEQFYDPSGRMEIGQVASPGVAFKPVASQVAMGYVPGAVWLRFKLNAAASAPDRWWLEIGRATLDRVTLYRPSTEGKWIAETQGDELPWASRAVKSRNSVFVIEPLAGAAQTYYLRVSSTGAMNVFGRFWQPAAYVSQAAFETFLMGGFALAAVVFSVINLTHWRSLRERLFLYYGLYIFAISGYLLMAEGIVHFLLDASRSIHLESPINFLQVMGFAMLALVSRGLLQLRQHHPLFDKLVLVASLGLLGTGLLAQVFDLDHAIKPWVLRFGMLEITLIALVSLWIALRDDRRAWLFLLGFAPLLISLSHSILGAFGFSSGLGWINFMPMLATLAHMALMQFIVNYRISKVRLAHEQALGLALQVEQQAAQKLAHEVEIRTAELRDANAGLQKTQEQLQAALQQQKLFLGMVAHEFRNPLAVIDSATHLLDLKHAPGSIQGSVAARIRRATHRLTLLLDNFLTRGRIESGGMVARFEPMQPQVLAGWAQETAELLSERHQFEIRRTGADDPFQADPQLIRVLIANLLSNAFKYAPAGSMVSMHLHRDEEECRIEVRDQGPGVPAQERSRLFLPYRRGEEAGQQPGAGLGLFIVRSIAELHGGSVELASGPDAGTCFIVTLPSRNKLQ